MDTPGVHKPGSHLDRRMLQEVYEALETRDLVLVLMDATRRVKLEAVDSQVSEANPHPSDEDLSLGTPRPGTPGVQLQAHGRESTPKERSAGAPSEDEFLFGLIRKLDCPVFLVLTKIDLVPKDRLLPLIDTLTRQFHFAQIIPVSARKRDGLDLLLRKIVEVLPTGQRYYPKDQYTDQPQRFMVAELIRESILIETGEEVPYASAVVIEQFEEPEPMPSSKTGRKPLTRIAAAIYCERGGQKAILIGKGGAKLKEIGTGARRKIESLLGTRVYLELRVIVEPNWRESKSFVQSLGWRNQLERLAESSITEKSADEKE